MLTQGQPHSRYHSPGPSHKRISQYDDDGNTQCTSEEPRPHTLPKLLDKDSRGEREENVSELEKDMLLAFEEHVKSSLATAPSSLCPHRYSTESLHPQIDKEHDQSRTNYGRLEEPEEQQRQEVAVDAMQEMEDNDGEPERGKQREKRQRQDRKEEVGSDCSHNTNDKDDKDNEEPRPAKRRKLPSAPTYKALTPPLDYNSKACLKQPHSVTLPLAMQLEVDDTQSQADPGNLPTPIDDEQHHIS
jgi:hypothetical protein